METLVRLQTRSSNLLLSGLTVDTRSGSNVIVMAGLHKGGRVIAEYMRKEGCQAPLSPCFKSYRHKLYVFIVYLMLTTEAKTAAARLSSLSTQLGPKRTLNSTTSAKMPLMTGTGKPRVILGTMTFGPDKEKGARITSLDTYNSILDKFQQSGYNEIDTARVYIGGKQEAFTRDAKWKERGLTCATKWYPHTTGAHKGDVVEAKLNESLKELGTDCIDIFYLHAPDRSVPFKETLSKLNDLHKQGKFVQLGLSNFTAFEVAECVMICHANGWVRPTIWQGMYNAITRSIEAELIPACRRYGLDVVVYNPVAGGIFSGKYKASEVPSSGRFSDAEGVRGTMYRKRYFKDATFEALRIIEPVVQKHNLTLIETAFRWLMHHSQLKLEGSGQGSDGIIIGVSSQEQLETNLKCIEEGPLPDEVVKALDEAWLVCKPTTANYWHLDLNYTYDTKEALFGS